MTDKRPRGRPATNAHFVELVRAMAPDDCFMYPLFESHWRAYRNTLTAIERSGGGKYRSLGYKDKLYIIRVA